VAHDVSLTYTRFDHMSPTAVGLATLLHVSVAAAFWWISPLHPGDQIPDAIEITMEQEVRPPPPTPEPPTPEPPVAQAPPPPPPVQQQSPPPRMGLRGEPIGTTMDPRAMLSAPQAAPKPEKPAEPPPRQEAAKPEPAKPEAAPDPAKEPPPQQQAALAPQPPPPPLQPLLEKALPPVEAPPPPVTSREIPRPAPPPPPKPPPQPAQRAPAPPPAARPPVVQQQPPSSPLSHIPQQHTPDSQQAARQAPSPFVNPAEQYGERKVQEDYLWGVVRKISQHRYYPKSSRENSEEGVVVARITVSREGRLIDVAVARSSGFPTLDNALIEVIRQSAPYPPLPSDMPGDRHTFLLPLNYRRTDQ
jgi:protein TonB